MGWWECWDDYTSGNAKTINHSKWQTASGAALCGSIVQAATTDMYRKRIITKTKKLSSCCNYTRLGIAKNLLPLFFQVMKVSLLQVQSCTRTRNMILVGGNVIAAAQLFSCNVILPQPLLPKKGFSPPPLISVCALIIHCSYLRAFNLSNTKREHTTEFSFTIHINIWLMLGTFLILF